MSQKRTLPFRNVCPARMRDCIGGWCKPREYDSTEEHEPLRQDELEDLSIWLAWYERICRHCGTVYVDVSEEPQ